VALSTTAPSQYFINGGDDHQPLAEYYDVPRVSTRPFLEHYMAQNLSRVDSLWAPRDSIHPKERVQQYMADVIASLLGRADCEDRQYFSGSFLPGGVKELGSLLEQGEGGLQLGKVPPMDFKDPVVPPGRHASDEPPADVHIQPYCRALNTPKLHLQNEDFALKPIRNTGWSEEFEATEAGASITFEVEVQGGVVAMYYMRGGTKYGTARCWLDGNKGVGVTLDTHWTYATVGSEQVLTGQASPGKHEVTCEVLPGDRTLFQILAVMAT